MKILYPLLCYFPSQGGGPANTIYWLNKALSKLGYQSIIISTTYGLPDNRVDIENVYEHFQIKAYFLSGSGLSFLKPTHLRKVDDCDVLHFSSLFFSPTIFYLMLGFIKGKKIVISPRGELYSSALARNSIKKKAYIEFLKLFQHKIYFHGTNKFEVNLIRNVFNRAKDIVEIPNFIELPQRKISPLKKQLLFLGRINPIKNIDLLLTAFSMLSEKDRNEYSLVIAGDVKLQYEVEYLNELKGQLIRQKIDKYVTFLGGAYYDEKEQLISESYCLILPSKSENFGNVVLEALCQSVPVIVSTGAPWEIVNESGAGYWVEPTALALKEAIENMISKSEKEYLIMKQNALDLVTDNFDINKNIHLWDDFYTKN